MANTGDPALYQTQYTGAQFTYSAPVSNGTYELSLYFAETQGNAAGQRVFNVTVNNEQMLTNYDVMKDAGAANTATIKRFVINVNNGQLILNFKGVTGQAAVAAIGLDPLGGKLPPRRVSSSGPVTDTPGPFWADDAVPTDDAGGGGSGPSASVGVSLPAGIAENTPGADLWAYNPAGPDVAFARTYRSSIAAANYASPGLSPGWTHNYDFVAQPTAGGSWGMVALSEPNGAVEEWLPLVSDSGDPTGVFLTPPGTPYIVRGVPYPTTQGQPAANVGLWKSLTVTFKDRSQWTFGPDPAGTGKFLLTAISNLVGHRVTLGYDASDRLVTLNNDGPAATALLTLTYGSNGLSSVSDSTGRSVTYTFGTLTPASGSPVPVLTGVSQINQPSAARWQYQYASSGPQLTSVLAPNPAGSGLVGTTTTYDGSGRVANQADAETNQRVYAYNATNTGVKVFSAGVSPSSGPAALTWTQNFLGGNNVDAGTQDSSGFQDVLAYNDSQNVYRPTTVTDPDQHATALGYDFFGSPMTTVDPRGTQATCLYDYSVFPLGQLVSVQEGTLTPTTYDYYGPGDGALNGLVKDVYAPVFFSAGNSPVGKTTFAYDGLGNVTGVTKPGSQTYSNGSYSTTKISYAYTNASVTSEALGEPVTVTASGPDYNGNTTTTTVSYKYDSRGNRTAVIDALGNETDSTYNVADQLLTVTNPDGTGTKYVYQYPGGPVRSVSAFRAGGAVTRTVTYTYGEEGELLSVSGAAEPVSYTYDGLFRVSTQSDGNGNKTTYGYDARGNLASIQYPGGDTEQYPSYDPAGNLLQRVDGNGFVTNYLYSDPEGLLTDVQYIYPSNFPGAKIGNVHLTYDGYGRRSSVTDGTGSRTYGYLTGTDFLFNIQTSFAGGPQNVSLTWGYAPDGSYTGPNVSGGSTSLGYVCHYSLLDGLGRVTGMKMLAQGAANGGGYDCVYPALYAYDADGRLVSTAVNFDANDPTPGLTTTYGYNTLGELTSLQNSIDYYDSNINAYQTSLLSTFTGMTYDEAGNRLGVTASVPAASRSNPVGAAYDMSHSLTFGYDTRSELTLDQRLPTAGGGPSYGYSFAYDGAQNPTTFRGAGVAAFNADNQLPGPAFRFDGAGDPTTYQGKGFAFDPEKRLTLIPGMLSAGYDADGLRAWKQDLRPAAQGGTGQQTFFVNGPGGEPLVELDPSGNLLAANFSGPDGPRVRYDALHGVVTQNTFDPEGNVAERVSFDGKGNPVVLDAAAYDAFGAVRADVDTATGQAETYPRVFGFGGQHGYYTDPETGLQLLTHRYYDAGTGRFLNRDPKGYGGGINLYGFAGNNPVNESDPSGFDPHHATFYWKRNGKLIRAWGEISGNQTKAEEALETHNFRVRNGFTHTEVRGLRRFRYEPGDEITIEGEQRACTFCKNFMKRTSQILKIKINYEYKENGRVIPWTAEPPATAEEYEVARSRGQIRNQKTMKTIQTSKPVGNPAAAAEATEQEVEEMKALSVLNSLSDEEP